MIITTTHLSKALNNYLQAIDLLTINKEKERGRLKS
jgi:hypothetical protein